MSKIKPWMMTIMCVIGLPLFAEEVQYHVVDGLKYFRSSSDEVYLCGYEGAPKNVVIPAVVELTSTNGSETLDCKVICVHHESFRECASLESVTIPKTVQWIGQKAFCDCKGLTTVTISSGVSEVGWGAFDGCSALQSVVIPSSVTRVGSQAFRNCSALESVVLSPGVVEIGGGAFEGCGAIRSMEIPSSVRSIGSFTFCDCSALESITIPSSVTNIGGGAFGSCSALQSVVIPPSVLKIQDGTFVGCTGLTSVTISSGVKDIGKSAFSYCSALEFVSIPSGVTNISEFAFDPCGELKLAIIPSSLTCLGGAVFDNEKAETFDLFFEGCPPPDVGGGFGHTSTKRIFFAPEHAEAWRAEIVNGWWHGELVQCVGVEPRTCDWAAGALELGWYRVVTNLDSITYSVYWSESDDPASCMDRDDRLVGRREHVPTAIGVQELRMRDDWYLQHGDGIKPIYYHVVGTDGSRSCCLTRRRYALSVGYAKAFGKKNIPISAPYANNFWNEFLLAGGVIDPAEDAVCKVDATKGEIEDQLALMKTKVKTGDIFVFYVFSHGSGDVDYSGFNTASEDYKIDELTKDFSAIGQCGALVISILDTCGSGQLAQKGEGAANTAWITATRGAQSANYDGVEGGSYSGWEYELFGRAFLDWGWSCGMAGKSGSATYYDLYEYAASRVRGIAFDNKQNPDVVHGELIRKVRAYNSIAKSSQSVPATPSQVVVYGGVLSSLTVFWRSVTDASYYVVECRECGETNWKWFLAPNPKIDLPNGNSSFKPKAGQEYEFRVCAGNVSGESSVSEIVTGTTQPIQEVREFFRGSYQMNYLIEEAEACELRFDVNEDGVVDVRMERPNGVAVTTKTSAVEAGEDEIYIPIYVQVDSGDTGTISMGIRVSSTGEVSIDEESCWTDGDSRKRISIVSGGRIDLPFDEEAARPKAEPGVWTVDADAVRTAAAEGGKLIVILCADYARCGYSQAFAKIAESSTFLKWAKSNGVYLLTTDASRLPKGVEPLGDATWDAEDMFDLLYWSIPHDDDIIYYPTLAISYAWDPEQAVGFDVARSGKKIGGVSYAGTADTLIAGLSKYLKSRPAANKGENKIVYALRGGANVPENPSTYSSDERLVLAPLPDEKYSFFMGWYPNNGVIEAGSSGVKTFTALWLDNRGTCEIGGVEWTYHYEDGGVVVGYPGIGAVPKDTAGEIVIPDKIDGRPVIGIGEGAFVDRKKLTKVKIPASVRMIDENAFNFVSMDLSSGYCPLQEIDVDPANAWFSSDGGILYDHDKKTLLFMPPKRTDWPAVVPSTVTKIAPTALFGVRGGSLMFLGDAPEVDGVGGEARSVNVYYYEDRNGWEPWMKSSVDRYWVAHAYGCPKAVSGFAATQGSSPFGVMLTWTVDPDENIDYTLMRSDVPGGGETVLAKDCRRPDGRYLDSTAERGKPYCYSIFATRHYPYGSTGSTAAKGESGTSVVGYSAEAFDPNGAVKTYDIRFHANGGEGTMDDLCVTQGLCRVLSENAFVNEGQRFVGWSTLPSGDVVHNDGEVIYDLGAVGETVDLYAVWSPGGAETQDGALTVLSENQDPAESNQSRDFVIGQIGPIVDSFGGDNPGYVLDGWSFSPAGPIEITEAESGRVSWNASLFSKTEGATDNNIIRVYARWKGLSYVVSYDGAGTEASPVFGEMDDQACVNGEPVTLSSNCFTRAGHVFDGWNLRSTNQHYADGDTVSSLWLPGCANVVLDAQWRSLRITIHYDANGGEGTMSANSEYGLPTLSECKFVKVGYQFMGWSSAANGRVEGKPNQRYWDESALEECRDLDVAVFAVWREAPVWNETNRTLDIPASLGGTTYDELPAPPATAAPEDRYEFDRWALDPKGTLLIGPEDIIPVGGVRLYPVWKERKPIVCFSQIPFYVDENDTVEVMVLGGNYDRESSVKVYLAYDSAVAADLDLKNSQVDGVKPKGGVKFPLTLKWKKGEVGEKSITLKVKKDSVPEGTESFTLLLAGELGLLLDEFRTTMVIIDDAGTSSLKSLVKNPSKTKGVKKFDVDVMTGNEDMGLAVGSGNYYKGAKVTVKAKAKTGYVFSAWYDTATGRKLSTSANYTFTVSKAVTLEARFSKRYFVRALADPADGATVSGSGWYAKNKTATLKAKTKSHFKFIGWYAAKADDPNAPDMTKKLSGSTTFKPKVTGDLGVFACYRSDPRLEIFKTSGGSVSGASKYAKGKTATLKAKVSKGYAFLGWYDANGNRVSQATTYKYKMGADNVVFTAKFKKESALAAPVLDWNAATEFPVGVSYSAKPKVSCEAAVKIVKVTGLPAGLSYKSGKVSGAPTAVKTYTVSVTVALATNSKKTWTLKQKLVVTALPAWAKGTFNGGSETTPMQATLTIGSTGKVSGKLCFANAVWTLTGTKYSKLDLEAKTATLSLTAKKGTTKKTVAVTVGEVELGGFAFSETKGFAFEARQNLWKSDHADRAAELALREDLQVADGLVLRFGANGAVTGVLTVGKNAFTCTTTLVPEGDVYRAYLYFAPNATKKFKGAVRIVDIESAGN